MTAWEQKIIDILVERYPSSASAATEGASVLRLSAKKLFPEFASASPDEKESFLEACESLERQGVLQIVWVKRKKNELLSSVVCLDAEKLFKVASLPLPSAIAKDARKCALQIMLPGGALEKTNRYSDLFNFLSLEINSVDAAHGIDTRAVIEFATLVDYFLQNEATISFRNSRATSVKLFSDSKHLEILLYKFASLLKKARMHGVSVPDFSLIQRSFPETLIAGNVSFVFTQENETQNKNETMTNTTGSIIGLPYSTIEKIQKIIPANNLGKTEPAILASSVLAPSVLMIENKETFYSLAENITMSTQAPSSYTCVLYTAGHPNKAVQSLVSILSKCGFVFFHSGDLDPDGILILQELSLIAGKKVSPVCMSSEIFDRYVQHGRKLEDSMLKRLSLVATETQNLPDIKNLIERIKETKVGVEQEIIDYFSLL